MFEMRQANTLKTGPVKLFCKKNKFNWQAT